MAAGSACAKALGQDGVWHVGGRAWRPAWLAWVEWGGGVGGSAGRGRGRSCRASWAVVRTWAFIPRDAGALEGCGWRTDRV